MANRNLLSIILRKLLQLLMFQTNSQQKISLIYMNSLAICTNLLIRHSQVFSMKVRIKIWRFTRPLPSNSIRINQASATKKFSLVKISCTSLNNFKIIWKLFCKWAIPSTKFSRQFKARKKSIKLFMVVIHLPNFRKRVWNLQNKNAHPLLNTKCCRIKTGSNLATNQIKWNGKGYLFLNKKKRTHKLWLIRF